MVKVNGELLNLAGKTVSDYMISNGFDRTKVAVEINGMIVPKAEYDQTVFKDQDTVEVVSFVGGG